MIRDALCHAVGDIEHIKRNAVVQILIVTIAFIMLMRVFPQGRSEERRVGKECRL